jgi:hypothetical protein
MSLLYASTDRGRRPDIQTTVQRGDGRGPQARQLGHPTDRGSSKTPGAFPSGGAVWATDEGRQKHGRTSLLVDSVQTSGEPFELQRSNQQPDRSTRMTILWWLAYW